MPKPISFQLFSHSFRSRHVLLISYTYLPWIVYFFFLFFLFIRLHPLLSLPVLFYMRLAVLLLLLRELNVCMYAGTIYPVCCISMITMKKFLNKYEPTKNWTVNSKDFLFYSNKNESTVIVQRKTEEKGRDQQQNIYSVNWIEEICMPCELWIWVNCMHIHNRFDICGLATCS